RPVRAWPPDRSRLSCVTDRRRRAVVERARLSRRNARTAPAAQRARFDRPAIQGTRSDTFERVLAVRRTRPAERHGPGEPLRVAGAPDPVAERTAAGERRECGYRRVPARSRTRLSNPRPSPFRNGESAAVDLSPRLGRPLLRGLAAAGSHSIDDPRAPVAR